MEGGGSHVEPFRALHESVDGPVTLKRDGDVLFGTGMMLVASRSVGPTASLREVLLFLHLLDHSSQTVGRCDRLQWFWSTLGLLRPQTKHNQRLEQKRPVTYKGRRLNTVKLKVFI